MHIDGMEKSCSSHGIDQYHSHHNRKYLFFERKQSLFSFFLIRFVFVLTLWVVPFVPNNRKPDTFLVVWGEESSYDMHRVADEPRSPCVSRARPNHNKSRVQCRLRSFMSLLCASQLWLDRCAASSVPECVPALLVV